MAELMQGKRGLIMGVAVHGMDIGRAFETYAILTVGDGLVTQIPAVIISIASALLLARALDLLDHAWPPTPMSRSRGGGKVGVGSILMRPFKLPVPRRRLQRPCRTWTWAGR